MIITIIQGGPRAQSQTATVATFLAAQLNAKVVALIATTATFLLSLVILGGFDASFVTVSDLGYADPTWIVGEDAESGQRAELVVIASDGRGGEVLWRGSGEVE
mgnify:CR=1 FL=1